MKPYIGVKLINAKPMNRSDYTAFRRWTLPSNENGEDAGYLVEYVNGGTANTEKYRGYISWSPREVFDKAYRKCIGMTLGLAIEAMKKGYKVARKGWNGKGIFIGIQPSGSGSGNMTSDFIYIDTTELQTDNPDAPKLRVPWLASQTDMLAEDYIIYG